MLEVKSEFAKCVTSTGKDPTGHGRLNYVNVVNEEKICKLFLHVNAHDRNQLFEQSIVNAKDSF